MVMVSYEDADNVISDPAFEDVTKAYGETGLKELVGETWSVDTKQYSLLAQAGILKAFTVRVDGRMVGFASLTLSKSPHTGKPVALVESIFVLEEYRRYSMSLIAVMKQYARANGFPYLSVSAPVGSRFDHMLSLNAKRERAKHVYNMYLMETGDGQSAS